jgi:hypothetical protein
MSSLVISRIFLVNSLPAYYMFTAVGLTIGVISEVVDKKYNLQIQIANMVAQK